MYISAFILGLLGSFHCIGMCGPIAFMLSLNRTNAFKKSIQIFFYHFGRLIAYGLIGLIFGLIGKSLFIFGFQQQLSIFIGVLMILMVIIPQKISSKYNFYKPFYSTISKIKTILGASFKKKTLDTFLTIGFLNGFLPCGLVYIALFTAIANGKAIDASLHMIFFGLGTLPLMTTAIYFTQKINSISRQKIQKVIPIFIVIIGCLFIIRGLGLGIPYLSPSLVYDITTNSVDCH